MFVTLFVVPLAAYTLYRLCRGSPAHALKNSILSTIWFVCIAIITYVFKESSGLTAHRPVELVAAGNVLTHLSMLPISLLTLIACTTIGILSLLLLALFTKYSAIVSNHRTEYVAFMMGVASVVMIAAFMTFSYGLQWYLVFVVLTLVVIASIGFREKVVWLFLITFLLSGVIFNVTNILTPDLDTEHQGLVTYLKDNNLTYGYTEFTLSSTLTYLSHGDLKVFGVSSNNTSIKLNPFYNEELWVDTNRSTFILWSGNSTPDYCNVHQPEYNLSYGSYNIYVYNHPFVEKYVG